MFTRAFRTRTPALLAHNKEQHGRKKSVEEPQGSTLLLQHPCMAPVSLTALALRAHRSVFFKFMPKESSMLMLSASHFPVVRYPPTAQLPPDRASASSTASTDSATSVASRSSSASSATAASACSFVSSASDNSLVALTNASASCHTAGIQALAKNAILPLVQQIQRALRLASQLWAEQILEQYRLQKMQKQSLSSKTFLGGLSDPVDISVRDIQHQGLPTLLASCMPLCYFVAHLLQEQTIENLFFVLDAEAFRKYPHSSTNACRSAAEDLFALYLAPDGYFELNVSHQIRKRVIMGIQDGSSLCYAPAFDHVVDLLQESFVRFKRGSWWSVMSENLGSKNILHDNATATEAMQFIQSCIPKEVSTENDRMYHLLAIRVRLDLLLEERLARFFYDAKYDYEEST